MFSAKVHTCGKVLTKLQSWFTKVLKCVLSTGICGQGKHSNTWFYTCA